MLMNVLIADDEPQVRAQLRQQLSGLAGYCPLEPVARDGGEALRLSGSLQPDLLLLASHLPGLDGLQVLAGLCGLNPAPAVVLCCRNGEAALEPGLQASGISLLQWPAGPEALQAALARAVRPERQQLAALIQPGTARQPRHHMGARTRRGIELVPLEQVLYFAADHKYVTLRHEQGEILLDEPLRALEEEFGPRFVRIHRNALVARNRMLRLQRTPLGHFLLYLQGLEEGLTVSRRHVTGVRRLMQGLPDTP